MHFSSDHYEPVTYPEPHELTRREWEKTRREPAPHEPAPLDRFHWHEALDRAGTLADLFETMLLDHPVIAQTPELASHAAMIGDALRSLYQMVGDADPHWVAK